jgi:hypothetical protein
MVVKEKSNASKRVKHWFNVSKTTSLISRGGLNGYNNVMCEGIPARAEGSCFSRKGLTNCSASGTKTTIADWSRSIGS